MDNKLTQALGEWLQTAPEKRDFEQGTKFFLQLSNNKVMYRNMLLMPARYEKMLEYQLQKYYNFRVRSLTHDEVAQMQQQADVIAEEHHLDKPRNTETKSENEEFKSGKRADHDSLPEEIQALYLENLPIMQKMRELHLRLRTLSTENSTCPDSERYPFLKELIALDKKYHDNWKAYDNYGKE